MKTITFAEAVAACAAGKKVECSMSYGQIWHHKKMVDLWDPYSELYRLAESEPKRASGHNPDKLTEERVGIADGWRLLTEEESTPSRRVPETEWWNGVCWQSRPPGDSGWWCGPDVTIRTKKPPGYFMPKPKRTVPCQGLDDYPVFACLLRSKSDVDTVHGVTGFVATVGVVCNGRLREWDELADHLERSLDGGRTWLPCYKEVEE